MKEDNRVLVVGAGAIGGAIGALLSRAGRDVVFLVKREETAAAINAKGLTLHGVRGTFTVHPLAEAKPECLSGPFLAALVAVKAYDLSGALRPLAAVLPAECPVVSLQNGICLDELEGAVGRERAVGCVVGWGATMLDSTEMELTSEGDMVIGSRVDSGSRLSPIRELISQVFPVTISDDILADLYSKLVINSCITTLGALSGMTLGWMLSRRLYRSLFIDIIREAMSAADSAGIKVPPYAGKLDYYAFLKGSGPLDGLRRHIFIRLMGVKYKKLKSSSLQSLERGKPTEVEYFNGFIVRLAREHGLSAPLNERLVRMVHELEAHTRRIGPENFDAMTLTRPLTDLGQ